jgi:hypothetical protein
MSTKPAFLLPWLLLASCRHTFESSQEPSDEQQLELYRTTAFYLYEDGSLLRAQDQAVKALEIDPEDRSMRRMIGWIRLRMGTAEDVGIAETFFRKLRSEGDESQATLLGLATATERLGTACDAAARSFEEGTGKPRDGADPAERAARLSARAVELWKEALGTYREALEGPEGTTAMNGLQRVHALLGSYEESLVWSQRLLERSEEERAAWRNLLTQSDLTEKEEALYQKNERISSDLMVDTHLFAAAISNRLGKKEDALAHLDQVAEDRPDLPQVFSQRAQLRAQTGAYAGAIEDLDRFLKLSDAPFEDPDVRRAFELRHECEAKLSGEEG